MSGATKYHVTYTNNGGQSWKLAALNHAGSSIAISGVDNGKSYVVGVRAGNATGWSGWVNSPQAGPYTPPQPTPTPTPTPEPTPTPQPAPAAPTGLTATAGDQSVTLAWNDPADSTITGYEYRTRYAGVAWGDWTAISAANSHTVTGLTNGKEYRFKLRAVNATGASKPGPQSAPWYVAATPNIPTPDAPTGVTVSVNVNVMTVSWNAVSGADGYDVRTKTGSADWVIVASNVSGTTTDVNILEVPDYTGVRARNGNAVSAWTDVSRLPAPDIFGSSAGASAQAQSQGGQAQNTLAAPANVTVTRLNGGESPRLNSPETLTVKWDAVTGATGYRIACGAVGSYGNWRKCGKDGSNWKVHGTSAGTTGATVSYFDGPTSDNNTGSWVRMTYEHDFSVIVQAVKDGSPGDWSAPFDAYPAFPLIWSRGKNVPANYQALDASIRAATGFTLVWTHPYYAAGYVAECAEMPSGSWTKCSEDRNVFSEETVNGNAVTVGQAHLYGSAMAERIIEGIAVADLDLATTGTQALDPWKSYDVRVRTTNPAGQSALTYPPLSITDPYYDLQVSNVTATGARLSIPNHTAAWWYQRTSPSGDSTCHSVTAGTSLDTLSGLSPGTSYTYKVYDATGCNSADEKDSVTFTTDYSLTASSATTTAATLTLAGYTGNWWLKKTAPTPAGNCTAGESDYSHALSNLTAGTTYTYKAYSDSACSTLLATRNFNALSYVTNLNDTDQNTGSLISASWRQAVAFTTGANANGYTLQNVTVQLKNNGASGGTNGLELKLHPMVGSTYSAASAPSGTAVPNTTLTGTAPTGSGWTDTTYTCSGAGCSLSKDTTYFVVATFDGGGSYQWDYAASETQTTKPDDSGWDIKFGHYYDDSARDPAWASWSDYNLARFEFTLVPTLSTSSVTATGATLTIANHSEDWYYKATTGPHTSCQGPISETSATLSGLTANTSHTYTAYSDNACTTLLATAEAFTTLSYVTNLTSDKESIGGSIRGGFEQSVAFTTGTNANGYTLQSVTVPLLSNGASGGTNGLELKLHAMVGSTYSSASVPSSTAVANATLTGTPPTTRAWANTTYTCSGAGCSLSASTTYFIVATWDGGGEYRWAYALSETQTAGPTNNGWDIEFGHYKEPGRAWKSFQDYNLARLEFTTP